MFSKVLVANRGEIAVRVLRALEELGIASVAVYSDPDADALHVRRADEAHRLGPGPAPESYLAIAKILDAAERSGAEAIHPGYGFLAESPEFARACEERGLVWVGPPAEAIAAMGSKTRARELMRAAGVPIVPGTTAPVAGLEEAREAAEEIGYPVAIKAAGGGGGKGFRVAPAPGELASAVEGAAGEGERFFADPRIYVERYLPDPRHVEVQVLADAHGNVVHLGERDCSVQRRHQKLIEECPAPLVGAELRERMGQIAVEAARAVGYRSAGTIEGLLQDGEWLFLEMNTRVQVEHPVTELATGIDIVREQLLIAAGEPLSFAQEDVVLRGHAIECRINAEDAGRNFAPAPGRIGAYREPAGPGVRVDSGIEAGSEVLPFYDPMVAKVVVWDRDRESATRRMRRALAEMELEGLPTLISFHRALLASDEWRRGETCRDLLADREWLREAGGEPPAPVGEPEAAGVSRQYAVEVSGKRFDVRVTGAAAEKGPAGPPNPASAAADGAPAPTARAARRRGSGGSGTNGTSGDALLSPLRGRVLKVEVEVGARVVAGDPICIVEAMKMENEVAAHRAGTVEELGVSEGASVDSGDVIAVIR